MVGHIDAWLLAARNHFLDDGGLQRPHQIGRPDAGRRADLDPQLRAGNERVAGLAAVVEHDVADLVEMLAAFMARQLFLFLKERSGWRQVFGILQAISQALLSP